MAEDNLSAPAGPVATTPPSEEELISDLSNLLEPPETDRHEEPEEHAAAPAEDDDPLGMNDAEDVEQTDPDDPDGSDEPEIKGGRFAPDSAKVTLDDGTVISVAELKRNNLFQRDYTKHRQEDAEARRAFDAEREQVSQYAQSLDQFREYATWYAETHIPKQPQPFAGDARTDPQGFLEWQQSMGQWQQHVQAYQAFQQQQQQEGERRSGESQKQANERIAKERDALLTAIPVLKDPVKGKQVWENIVSGANRYYGIPAEVLNTRQSHLDIVILRDALAYRRIKDAAPKVQAEVRKPVVRDGRRAPSSQAATREKQARTDRLRSTGSLQDGVAALMDFDL